MDEIFQIPGRNKGQSLCAAGLISEDGKNLEWFTHAAEGEFYRVIQTSDGGYLAVGRTSSSRIPLTNISLVYNPNPISITDDFDCPNLVLPYSNKAYVVKFHSDGTIDKQYIYSLADYANSPSIAANTGAWAWGVVEYEDGYMIVGSNNGRAFIMSLDFNLLIRWKGYLPIVNPNFPQNWGASNATKIATYVHNGVRKFVIGGVEVYNGIQTGFFPNPIAYSKFQVVYLMQLNNTSTAPQTSDVDWFNNDDFNVSPTQGTVYSDNSSIFDIDILKNTPPGAYPHLIVPVTFDCNGCMASGNNSGTGRVYNIDATPNGGNFTSFSFVDLGTVHAFDLKIGTVATQDGGYGVVSTKDGINYGQQSECNGTMYSQPYWNSDAYVAKFDMNNQLEWEKRFDDYPDEAPQPFPGNLKKQECLYHITTTDAGCLIISGNNGFNFDDSYLVRLHNNCQNEFFRDQVIADPTSVIQDLSSAHIIDAATLSNPYTGHTYVKGSIHVLPGYAWVIGAGAELEFADTRKCGVETNIIVHPGGKLEITDGAKLTSLINPTNDCHGNVWDGIQVWGNSSAEQKPKDQGFLTINNGGTIENARVGINVGKFGSFKWNGGIVRADNALFQNNRKSIGWNAYHRPPNTYGYASWVKLSDFICDAPMLDPDYTDNNGHPVGVGEHVSMYEVENIMFHGNNFINDAPPDVADRGYGILSVNAKYYVTPACTSYNGTTCIGSVPNTFANLQEGIHAASDGSTAKTIYVDGNVFDNNTYGITMFNVNMATVIRNEFNVGSPNHDGCVGLYMEVSYNYQVEENDFSNMLLFSEANNGIIVLNSGSMENEIYRNTFSGLNHGCIADLNNAQIFGQERGLQFRCNVYNDDIDTDIAVRNRIRREQGYCDIPPSTITPAGNQFYGSPIYNLYLDANASQYPFNYNHHSNNFTTPSVSGNITSFDCFVNFDPIESCQSKIRDNRGDEERTAYHNAQAEKSVQTTSGEGNRVTGLIQSELFELIRTTLNDTSLTSPVDSAIAILGTPENTDERMLLMQLQLDKGDSAAAQITMNELMLDTTANDVAAVIDSMIQVNLADTLISYNGGPPAYYVNSPLPDTTSALIQARIFHDLKTGSITKPKHVSINLGYAARKASKTNSVNSNQTAEVKPVPASDKISITLKKSYDEIITVEIIEPASGKIVLADKLNREESQKELNIQSLMPGFYTCIIKSSTGVIAIKKIIKI